MGCVGIYHVHLNVFCERSMSLCADNADCANAQSRHIRPAWSIRQTAGAPERKLCNWNFQTAHNFTCWMWLWPLELKLTSWKRRFRPRFAMKPRFCQNRKTRISWTRIGMRQIPTAHRHKIDCWMSCWSPFFEWLNGLGCVKVVSAYFSKPHPLQSPAVGVAHSDLSQWRWMTQF